MRSAAVRFTSVSAAVLSLMLVATAQERPRRAKRNGRQPRRPRIRGLGSSRD